MDILPIQGSAVPCERVFSSAKETMAARRSRLSPGMMRAFQMLKFSVKQGRGLDFTAGFDWMDELHDLENITHTWSVVPEDLGSFRDAHQKFV